MVLGLAVLATACGGGSTASTSQRSTDVTGAGRSFRTTPGPTQPAPTTPTAPSDPSVTVGDYRLTLYVSGVQYVTRGDACQSGDPSSGYEYIRVRFRIDYSGAQATNQLYGPFVEYHVAGPGAQQVDASQPALQRGCLTGSPTVQGFDQVRGLLSGGSVSDVLVGTIPAQHQGWHVQVLGNPIVVGLGANQIVLDAALPR
jgi:hypothetical protein